MKSNTIYNTEMNYNGGVVVLGERDSARYGIFAVCSHTLHHIKKVVKKTYYLEAYELQNIDGQIMPVSIAYVSFKTKKELMLAFNEYTIE